MVRTPYIYAASLAAAAFTLFLPASSAAQWSYPYPGYVYGVPESDLRFSVTPKEAAVYVDGYFAGKVDEFDGAFQRLHVAPGEHEVIVYLAGHRSLKQHLYLSPGATRKIAGTLEPVASGDPQDAEPVPSPPREDQDRYERLPPQGPPPGRRAPIPQERERAELPPAPPQPSRFGTLSIRLQPGDATLIIDGERQDGPGGDDRLIVQVTPGRHKVEAEKDGYVRYVTEIDANRDQTVTVNISMTKSK